MDRDISQLMDVIGCTELVASGLLEASNNDLDLAVTLYFQSVGDDDTNVMSTNVNTTSNSSGDGGYDNAMITERVSSGSDQLYDESPSSSVTPSPVLPTLAASSSTFDGVRAPIPQRMDTLLLPESGSSMFLPHRMRRVEGRSVAKSAQLDPFYTYSPNTASTATSDYRNRNTLESLFQPPLHMTFKGGLEQCKEEGVQSSKWILVNIQDPREFQCQILNRDVWSDKTIVSLIQRCFLLWQVHFDSEDGAQYARIYGNSVPPPHIAIIDPRTGERIVYWNGSMNVQTCIDYLNNFLDEHRSLRNFNLRSTSYDTRSSTSSLYVNQDEEAQIAAAIAASLKERPDLNVEENDAEFKKPTKKQCRTIIISDSDNNSDESERCDSAASFGLQESENGYDYVKDATADTDLRVMPMPILVDEPTPNDMDSTRISFRFPDGSRIVRRFLKTSHTVTDLFTTAAWYLNERGHSCEFDLLLANVKLSSVSKDTCLEDAGAVNALITVMMND